jgi:hypothetical protein
MFVWPALACLCKRRYKASLIWGSLVSLGLMMPGIFNYAIATARDLNWFS